jgi:hypothetical protein
LDLGNISIDHLLQSRFHIAHGLENIEDLLLANTQSLVSLGLSDNVLGVDTGIETLFVEVRCGLVVVEVFKLLGHLSVLLETLLDVAVSQVALGVNEVLTELEQGVFCLLELALLSLVEFVLFLQFLRRLDLRGRGLSGDVEEVYVGLDEALLQKLDGLGFGSDFLLKFEIVVFFLEVIATATHELLVGLESVGGVLFAVLVQHGGLGLNNEFLLLFSL